MVSGGSCETCVQTQKAFGNFLLVAVTRVPLGSRFKKAVLTGKALNPRHEGAGYIESDLRKQRVDRKWCEVINPKTHPLVTYFLQPGSISYRLRTASNQHPQLGPVRTHEPVGAVS